MDEQGHRHYYSKRNSAAGTRYMAGGGEKNISSLSLAREGRAKLIGQYADNLCMKVSRTLIIFVILCAVIMAIVPEKADAFVVKYKEDWWRLYHVHYQQYPDDCIENIYWLEKAARADFANPMYALSHIENEKEWEKYRYMFQMHLNLKLVEQHLRLGRTYDKSAAYFYDAPWKEEYLRDLEKALSCYNAALVYWREASNWAEKANGASFGFMNLADVQYWEDERERVKNGSLDYGAMLKREIARVEGVKQKFLDMDENTY